MGFYQFRKAQEFNASVDEVWKFISDPANLKRITPDYMGFNITTKDLPSKMYAGMIISYKVSPLFGIKTIWVTEITQLKENCYFIDEQRVGPYKIWHHQHMVQATDKGTLMTDIVSYQPPLGFLGNVANSLIIKGKLSEIFRYRAKALMDKKQIIKIRDNKVGMIGYGMLSSLEALEEVLGRKYNDSIYWVHLDGFQRVWNFVGANNDPNLPAEYLRYDSFYIKENDTIPYHKSIFLNIMENKEVQINCALYFVTIEELAKFDGLEVGYKRLEVSDRILEYQFGNGIVYAYKALPEYEYNAPNTDQEISIIDQSYLNLVLASYDAQGSQSRKEFDRSTIPHDPRLVAPVIHKKVRE